MKKFSKLMLVGLTLASTSALGFGDFEDENHLKCMRQVPGAWQIFKLSLFGSAKNATFPGVPKRCVEHTVRTTAAKFFAGSHGLNLSGCQLSGLNLRNLAFPEGTDFSGADLNNANLADVNLKKANLTGANLRNADLRRANCKKANLTDANLSIAYLYRAKFNEADLTEADLRKVNLRCAEFKKANLTGANLRNACLLKANFKEANLTRADLSKALLLGANFEGARFDKNTNFDNAWRIAKANFTGAVGVKDCPSLQQELKFPRELRKATGEGSPYHGKTYFMGEWY